MCFACGRNNPGEDHAEYCKPRCKFCGDYHVTGAGSYKNKLKTPRQIKQRQWVKQNTELIAKMAPNKITPRKVAISRRFDFSEMGASSTRHEQNGVASRGTSRVVLEDVKCADVTSGRPKEARPPRPAPQDASAPTGARAPEPDKKIARSFPRGNTEEDAEHIIG
ncbi:hypothetical protein HPB51_001952 [Rhipicephalus microplus]|uniref:Uncharacterized protein n=1 Tax=Rhipicephalus microplus TaxID=6941 RepID=A0A9J6DZB0_RHIMP|nr:hypothetical protein HPB51_001952 [Rhipicephalus microplus]